MCFKEPKPVCEITINKNRLKKQSRPDGRSIIYMNDKQEFIFEFYNPTTKPVMAKIKLNGDYISTRGIVIRPGERVYVERYIDEPNKFIFETYTVGNNKSVEKAIIKNGLIEVDFFNEEIILPIYQEPIQPTITWPTHPWTTQPFDTHTTNITNSGNSTQFNDSNAFYSNTTTHSGNQGNDGAWGTLDMMSLDLSDKFSKNITGSLKKTSPLKKKFSKTKETGRINMGGESNQHFKTVVNTFNNWSEHTVKYQILPLSEKNISGDDLGGRQFCTKCGYKIKKKDVFCSKCGTKL